MEHLLALLDKVSAAIPLPGGTLLLVVGVVAEILMRLIPSARPKSLLLVAASALHGVGGLLSKLGEIVSKASGLLDGIVQNLKDEPPQA